VAPFATERERESSFPFTVFKYSCCSCLRTKFLSAASSGGRLFFSRLYLVLHFRSSIIIIRGVRHVISQPRARSNQKSRAKTFSPPGSARAIRKFKIPESSKSSFFLAPIFSSSHRCVVIFPLRPTTRLEFVKSLSFNSFYFITRKITKIKYNGSIFFVAYYDNLFGGNCRDRGLSVE
jgi:hypothetical protein